MDRRIKEYIYITVGVAVAVAGLNLFLVPNKIAAGGISGIATILYHILGVPLGLAIAVLNIPLFLIGIRIVGKSFALRTIMRLCFIPCLRRCSLCQRARTCFLAVCTAACSSVRAWGWWCVPAAAREERTWPQNAQRAL